MRYGDDQGGKYSPSSGSWTRLELENLDFGELEEESRIWGTWVSLGDELGRGWDEMSFDEWFLPSRGFI